VNSVVKQLFCILFFFQLKPGLLSLVGTLLPMLPFVKSFACTPVQPSTAAWTQPGFDYTNWPFIKNAPTSAIGATLTQLGATSFALQNINRVLYCRFYCEYFESNEATFHLDIWGVRPPPRNLTQVQIV
jgi:hypothetical protein